MILCGRLQPTKVADNHLHRMIPIGRHRNRSFMSKEIFQRAPSTLDLRLEADTVRSLRRIHVRRSSHPQRRVRNPPVPPANSLPPARATFYCLPSPSLSLPSSPPPSSSSMSMTASLHLSLLLTSSVLQCRRLLARFHPSKYPSSPSLSLPSLLLANHHCPLLQGMRRRHWQRRTGDVNSGERRRDAVINIEEDDSGGEEVGREREGEGRQRNVARAVGREMVGGKGGF